MHTKALDALRMGTAHLESGPLPVLPLATHPVRPAQLLDSMTRYHVPGASIAVIANHRLEWACGYGVCEAGWLLSRRGVLHPSPGLNDVYLSIE